MLTSAHGFCLHFVWFAPFVVNLLLRIACVRKGAVAPAPLRSRLVGDTVAGEIPMVSLRSTTGQRPRSLPGSKQAFRCAKHCRALSQLNCGVLLPVVVAGWVKAFAEPTTSAGRWVPQKPPPTPQDVGPSSRCPNFYVWQTTSPVRSLHPVRNLPLESPRDIFLPTSYRSDRLKDRCRLPEADREIRPALRNPATGRNRQREKQHMLEGGCGKRIWPT